MQPTNLSHKQLLKLRIFLQVREGEEPMSFQAAERFAPVMDEVFNDLSER